MATKKLGADIPIIESITMIFENQFPGFRPEIMPKSMPTILAMSIEHKAKIAVFLNPSNRMELTNSLL